MAGKTIKQVQGREESARMAEKKKERYHMAEEKQNTRTVLNMKLRKVLC
jgi:hypothetical protein